MLPIEMKKNEYTEGSKALGNLKQLATAILQPYAANKKGEAEG